MVIIEHYDDSTLKRNTDIAMQVQTIQKSMLSARYKFIFINSKEGVGKTNTIVNLAIALSKRKMNVGLMDINFHNPKILRMLGLNPLATRDSANRFIPMTYLDNLKVASIDSVIKDRNEESGVWEKPLKISSILQFISSIYWGALDYLLVDTPAGPSEKLLSVIQAIPDAKIIIVTAPKMVEKDNAKKMIDFLKKEEISIFGWIENMRGFLCQNCGQRQEILSTGPINRTIFLNEIPFLGRIPIYLNLEESLEPWEAFYENRSKSQASAPYNFIVQKIMESH